MIAKDRFTACSRRRKGRACPGSRAPGLANPLVPFLDGDRDEVAVDANGIPGTAVVVAGIEEGAAVLVVCHEHRLDAGGDVVSQGLHGLAPLEHVAGLPGIVLRLHGEDRVLDVLGGVLGEHALPDVLQ